MKTKTLYRIYEIIPGALLWFTLLASIIISLIKPLWAIYFIILFDSYWLLRVLYLLIYMIASWKNYRNAIKTNRFQKLKKNYPTYSDYLHIIFLPVYNEPLEIIEETFESLVRCQYDLRSLLIVLTGEERAGAKNFFEKAGSLAKKYESHFKKIFINLHPANLSDDIPGNGSNLHHAGKNVKILIDEWGRDYEKIIVSTFDIDTRPHPQYFACLTYTYLGQKNPSRASFQPIAVYNNNIWESNPIILVVASSTTFWLLTDLARPDRLYTFSSHSMSFRALVDAGFWDKNTVNEDSKIFLQCFTQPCFRENPRQSKATIISQSLYSGFSRLRPSQYLAHFPPQRRKRGSFLEENIGSGFGLLKKGS